MSWITIWIPDECEDRQAGGGCTFNNGAFGYCLCHEHNAVRHGNDESRKAYYDKHPERVGKIKHIEDDFKVH